MALFNPFRESLPVTQRPPPLSKPPPHPGSATVDFESTQKPNRSCNSRGHRGQSSNRGFQGPPGRFQRGGRGRPGQRGRPGRGGGARFRGGWRGDHHGDSNSPGFGQEEVAICEFQCEACERVFVNEVDLNDHLKLHVSCRHCNYAALQQLVDLHTKLVHDKHLASKVMEQSPEEIAEYLAERRRRFPRRKVDSDVDADQRSDSAQENLAPPSEIGSTDKKVIHEGNVRGNRRGKFGQVVDRSRNSDVVEVSEGSQRSRQRKRRRTRASRGKAAPPIVQTPPDDGPQVLEGVPRFRGLPPPPQGTPPAAQKSAEVMVAEDCDEQDAISDVDDFTPALPVQSTAATVLASLMASYSDSENEEEPVRCSGVEDDIIHQDDKDNNNDINTNKSDDDKGRLGDNSERLEEPPMKLAKLQDGLPIPNKDSEPKPSSPAPLELREKSQLPSLIAGNVHRNAHKKISNAVQPMTTLPDRSIAKEPRSTNDLGNDLHSTLDPVVKAVVRSLVDKVVLAERARSVPKKPRRPPTVNPPMSRRKLSLLEKLLAKDIRHERNILLQCVDFVVQNKFFDGMDYDV